MLEASVSAMGWAVSNYLVSGVAPEPMGDQNATAAPSGTFEAADGPLNIAANRQEQFETLCALLDRPDLCADPRFADREARKTHRADAQPRAERRARRADRRRVGKHALRRRGAGRADPHRAAGARLRAARGPRLRQPSCRRPRRRGGTLRVTGNGVLVDGSPLRPSAPPPTLGEHNDAYPDVLDRWRSARPATIHGGRS